MIKSYIPSCAAPVFVLRALSLVMLVMAVSAAVSAQVVPFPQVRQPGEARGAVSSDGDRYELYNDLFRVKYLKEGNALKFDGCEALGLLPGADLFDVTLGSSHKVGSSQMTLRSCRLVSLPADTSAAVASRRLPGQALEAEFSYGPLVFGWRAVLRDGSHYLRNELAVRAESDIAMQSVVPMIYRVTASNNIEVVGNTRGSVLASSAIFAGLETPTGINTVEESVCEISNDTVVYIKGLWSRNATLAAGKEWNVSSVVGILAPGQSRRSFLAYSERERAVPWRPFPLYNSWYELNIDRNNSATYDGHMTAADCVGVVNQWKSNLFDRYNVGVKAFVWDDGWDEYGTWTFNKGFPHGFKEPYDVAAQIGAGTGAWLGPVGGYGTSGEMRRAYWTGKGGMQLSNPAYYKVFLDACSDMVDKYDFCFFKLDGISAQFSSVGPDAGTVGEENAEGIIDVMQAVRKIRPDMFFNATVGTWASPFWFHYADAVWRQEGDWGNIGDQGDDRERWITYRDRLVYENFVKNSPLCPINTLMTHGVILTSYGDVSKTMDYDGIVREMRCAFACGSGMVELYCDANLLNTINGGALWGDLAECIRWQQENADVLPDIHWIGGNPWDGASANVYGWASWNGRKATLALRNPSASPRSYTFTLRQAFEAPAYDTSRYRLQKAFGSQGALPGIDEGECIDLDTPVTVSLPASSVYVFNGRALSPNRL